LNKHQKHNLKRRFEWPTGSDPKAYLDALESQNGLCALCRQPPQKRRLLRPDVYRSGIELRLVCPGCLHVSRLRQQMPEQLATYLEANYV
jgi:hypothetical protein